MRTEKDNMITNRGQHYVYRHIKKSDGIPFYIGIGKKSKDLKSYTKIKTEYSRAFSISRRTEYWHNIVSKHDYEVEILLESDDYDFILKKEIEFVALYGRTCNSTGVLCNIGEGGDINPMLGRKGELSPVFGKNTHSEEQKEKWSKERKGKLSNGENGSAREVIDFETKQKRGCAKEVAEEYNINYSTFCFMLRFEKYNTTNYLYIEDYDAGLKPNQLLNHKIMKPVIDIVTKQRYTNAGTASKATGIERRKILRYLNRIQHNPTNLIFVEEYKKGMKPHVDTEPKRIKRQVINIKTLEIFDSMSKASKTSKISKTTFESKMRGFLKNDTDYMLLEDYKQNNNHF